jgi:xanthine dehydrogenase YagS FAD-binding subunit
MRAFEYSDPITKEQAVSLLGRAGRGAQVLAGGTDLLSLMKDGVVTPRRLVNIKGIEELRGISFDAKSGLRLGALATFEEVLDDAGVRERFPAIATAVDGVRSPQIRSLGTVGGDLCQRPHCWYYRAGFGLLAQDGGRSLVLEGDNRYHAILGNAGPAYFVNPSSLAPALVALGATIRLFGSRGPREVAADRFFVVPKSNDDLEHDLRPDEILTEIQVPPPSGPNATYEVREKEGLDWPLVTASVALKMGGDRVESARVVLGHVAPVPWRSPDAETALAGKTVGEEVAQEAGEAAVRKAKALAGNAYKIQLARVAVKRVVLQAVRGGAQ